MKTASSEELANNILADVGESVTTLSMKKAQSLKVQTNSGNTGNKTSDSSGKLREIEMCDDKLADFLIQKSILENQLSALEREITMVTSRRDTLRSEYVSLSSQHLDKISQLSAGKAEAERTEMLDTNVRAVTATYSTLDRNVAIIEEELSAILRSSEAHSPLPVGAPASSMVIPDLSVKRALKQQAFHVYVSSEVACIGALVTRIEDLKSKQQLKSREIVEYQRIGIEALVQDLQKDLDKLGADHAEDVAAVRALQECLVECIKASMTPADLAAADKEGSASVWTPARLLVGGLQRVLTGAELQTHPLLMKFGVQAVSSDSKLSAATTEPTSPITESAKKSKKALVAEASSPARPVAVWGSKSAAVPSASVSVSVKEEDKNDKIDKQSDTTTATSANLDEDAAAKGEAPLPKRSARAVRNKAVDKTSDSPLSPEN